MIVSIKTGSLGLNLTMAQNVVFTDFWWNPQLEAQAIDRIHRFGQTQPVDVYRIIAEHTIDERILNMQEKKRELFLTVMGETGDQAEFEVMGEEEEADGSDEDEDEDDDEDDEGYLGSTGLTAQDLLQLIRGME